MEKVSDLFKELKDRINNPLVISFVISWVFLNWRIFVGLFFYKSNELGVDKYKSYIDLIEQNNVDHYHRATAILIAIIYTLFYPLIKQCILVFGTFFDKWGTSISLRVINAARVPFSEVRAERNKNQRLQDEVTSYTVDREELESQLLSQNIRISEIEREKSESLAKSAQDTNNQITEINNQLTEAFRENQLLKSRLAIFENINIEFLFGWWHLIYHNDARVLIKITSGDVTYYNDYNSVDTGRMDISKRFTINEVTGNEKAIIITLQSYEPPVTKFFWRVELVQSDDGKYFCRSLYNDIQTENDFILKKTE